MTPRSRPDPGPALPMEIPANRGQGPARPVVRKRVTAVPEFIPGLGTRHTVRWQRCIKCNGPTWMTYGDTPVCVRCAPAVAEEAHEAGRSA